MLHLNKSALRLISQENNEKIEAVFKKHKIDLESYEFGENGNWVEFNESDLSVRLDGVFTPFDLDVIHDLLKVLQK